MDRGGKKYGCENLKATRQSYGEKLAELGEKNKV